MGKEDIVKYQFPKGISGNPKGRPKKYTTLLKEHGYKMSEINDTIQVMLSMTTSELVVVRKDENATLLERTVANALIKSLNKGSLYSVETLMNRVFGFPKQQVEAEVTMPPPLFPDVQKENKQGDK